MKRRDFLKLIGVALLAPSVLAAKAEPVENWMGGFSRENACLTTEQLAAMCGETVEEYRKVVNTHFVMWNPNRRQKGYTVNEA